MDMIKLLKSIADSRQMPFSQEGETQSVKFITPNYINLIATVDLW